MAFYCIWNILLLWSFLSIQQYEAFANSSNDVKTLKNTTQGFANSSPDVNTVEYTTTEETSQELASVLDTVSSGQANEAQSFSTTEFASSSNDVKTLDHTSQEETSKDTTTFLDTAFANSSYDVKTLEYTTKDETDGETTPNLETEETSKETTSFFDTDETDGETTPILETEATSQETVSVLDTVSTGQINEDRSFSTTEDELETTPEAAEYSTQDISYLTTAIVAFSLAYEKNRYIKLEDNGIVIIDLIMKMNGNTSTDIEIALKNESQILKTENHTVTDEDLAISNGSISLTFPINHNDFPEFGQYDVLLMAYPSNSLFNEHKINLTVFYDKRISYVQITCPMYVVFGTTEVFTGSVSGGSDVGITWYWTVDVLNITSTQTRKYTKNNKQTFNISQAGLIIVNMNVSNAISSSTNSCTLMSLNRIGDYRISPVRSVFNTTETAEFRIGNKSTIQLPMELVSLKIFLNYSLNSVFPISDYNITNFTFTHNFEQQGPYIVSAELTSRIESCNISATVEIWDNLDVLEIKASKIYAKVEENIKFALRNYPPSNFNYNISIGDDTIWENVTDKYHVRFIPPEYQHNYSQPGNYTIKLFAWNRNNSKTAISYIQVQHPFVCNSLSISPKEYNVPNPDGIVEYTLTYAQLPFPSNATCKMENEANTVLFNAFYNAANVTYMHRFKSAINKPVRFNCSNFVSLCSLISITNVVAVQMRNISLIYQNPTPMNITRSLRNPFKSTPVPTNVTFRLSLNNCSRLPYNIKETWHIGDKNTSIFYNRTDFNRTFLFTSRGTFELKVIFRLENDSFQYINSISTGAMKAYCIKTKADFRKVLFSVTIEMDGKATFGFDLDSGNLANHEASTLIWERNRYKTRRHIQINYTEYGFKMPKFIGHNNKMAEEIYLDDHLIAEYDLVNEIELHTTAEKRNQTVPLPPGNISILIGISPHLENSIRPLVNCTISTGDEVDRIEYTSLHNITNNSPLIVNHTYYDLGNQTIDARCQNFISSVDLHNVVVVINVCFGDEGIFDRQFSMRSKTMALFDSSEVYIANRMSIFCPNNDIEFSWENCSSLVERKGVCMINAKSPLNEAYRIHLNVSIPSLRTYIFEPMYVKIISSSPFAYIDGGSEKKVVVGKAIFFLAKKYSNQINRFSAFSWTIDSPEYQKNTTGRNISHKFESPGNYQITLTVQKDSKYDHFTQTVQVKETTDDITISSIKCIVNCMRTVSTQSRIAVSSLCDICLRNNLTLEFHWTLLEENVSFDLDNMTITGIDGPAFALEGNKLTPGKEYTLILTAAKENETGNHNLTMPFTTREYRIIPNVTCTAVYFKDKLAISANCTNWKSDTYPVLAYLFETITKRKSAYGDIEDIVNYLYKGYEGSIFETPIQVGHHNFNSSVTFRIKAYNEFDDHFGIFEKIYSVSTPTKFIPNGGHDKEPVLNLYEEFNKTVGFIRRGGDTIRTFRYIGSVASFLMPYKENISVTTEKEILDGTKTTVTFYKDSDIEKLYKEIIHQMIVILSEEGKTCSKWTYEKFSLTDIHQILSSIDAVVRNPLYLSFESLEKVIILVEDMINCFTIRMDEMEIPLPNYYVHTMEEIVKHIVRVVNIIMDVMLPENLQDFSEELSQETILDELKTKKLRSDRQIQLINRNLTEGELKDLIRKSYLILNLRQHEREIQWRQINMSEAYYKRIQAMLTHVQATLLSTLVTGEKMEFHQPNLKLIVQKTTYTEFKKANTNNTNLQKYILGITHANKSSSPNSIVEVKIIVFGKNPLIFGENASSLTSDVFVYDFGDETVMDVKLRNRGKPQPYDFSPLYSSSIGELITHFYFDVMNNDDAILIYIKPHLLEEISSERPLYILFISPKAFPTTASFKSGRDYKTITSVRNWDTELGYKIFVPNGVCPKGVCYMGIKPLKEEEPEDLSHETMSSRPKREAVHALSSNQSIYNKNSTIDPAVANFTLQVITTACRAWDKTSNSWESNRCQVLSMTTIGETICRCTGHIFSTTFYVPLNMIDLYKVWGKFDAANAAVYGTMIAVLIVYLVLAVVLRREDKKDIERWAISFLCDHDSEDCYFYMITVYTGLRRRAGTTSNIHFVLSGSEDESGIRSLSDGERKGFQSGSIVTFVFGTKDSLGDLEYFRIWHDCSGQGPNQDWFLSKIEIDDLQTNERSIFLCDDWLSLDQGDGLIERVIPVSTVETLMAFKTLVAHQTQLNITDHHLWLSLLFRPRKSRFTRIQRLSCVLALLFLSMISNAMYYKSAEEEATYNSVQIGVFRLSVSALFVSLIGIILTTIPILFLSILFRNRRLKTNKTQTEGNENKKVTTTSQSFRIPPEYIKEHEKSLPYWILYIAWILLAAIILVSAFFLLLYSMEWGKGRSEEWLMSFFLSFFESILFVDPIKVLFVAVLFATVFKAIIYEKSEEVDIDQLKEISALYRNSDNYGLAAFASNILRGPDPLTQEELENLKAKRQEEKRAKKALIRLIIFAVYLFGLYSISFLERDLDSFHYKSNIDSYLYSSDNGQLGFSSINRTEDFINWLHKTFVPTLYPLSNYAGDELGVIDKQMFKDSASFRIGPAQLRQLRTERASCPFTRITWPYPCIYEYSNKHADTSEYCSEWKSFDLKCGENTNRVEKYYTAGAWKYTDAESIWGITKSGEYGTYDGGGYITRFTKSHDRAEDLVKEIVNKNWIDRNTRAVFLEFTLYNPNRNLFIHAIYLAEFIETGGIMKWTETQAFRPIVSADMVGNFTILCYLIFLFYLVLTTINVVYKVKKHGCLNFFKQPWNLVTTLNMFISYACVAVYIVRVSFAKETMKKFYDDKLSLKINDEFINFNHIVIWDNVFNGFFAIVVFLSTLQLLEILGYNKRFTQIISVVVNARGNIGGFGFIFILIYIIFATLGTLLFGVKLKEYKNFLSTCGTLANSFIGKNNVKSMVTAVPTFAELFYFSYMFCVIMTLITIFAAILNKSINEVKQTLNVEYEKLGIKHFIGKVVKDLFGIIFRERRQGRLLSEQENVQQTLLKDGGETYGILKLLSSSLHSFMKKEGNETKYQMNAMDCDIFDIQELRSKSRESGGNKRLKDDVFAQSTDDDSNIKNFKFI